MSTFQNIVLLYRTLAVTLQRKLCTACPTAPLCNVDDVAQLWHRPRLRFLYALGGYMLGILAAPFRQCDVLALAVAATAGMGVELKPKLKACALKK